jgi:hypothetical protein
MELIGYSEILIEIRRYTTAEGRDVFGEWLADLKTRTFSGAN